MKKILLTLIFVFYGFVSYAQKPVYFGLGMYVGGINVADTKAKLTIDENNKYKMEILLASQGLAKFLTNFNIEIVSTGKILDNKVRFEKQVSTSISSFGDTYTVLERKNGKTTITKYPDPESVTIDDLPGNPLAKANDSVSSILTLMQQIKHKKKCDIDMIVVTNHFMYEVKSQATKSKTLIADEYNVASGKATSCLIKFHRLDKQDNLTAYSDLDQGGADKKSTYPIFHFIKLAGIPYYIPVSIEATEQRFGSFRLNLQYVKYGDTVYKADEWDDADSFERENIDKLKLVPQRLINESKHKK